jgi:integrase
MPTFGEFSKGWYKTYVLTTNKPSEQYTKEGVLRVHLLPFFGETPLDKINNYQIEQFKALKKQAGLNPKTINNFLACLRKCLQCAIDWEKITVMPKMKKFPIDCGRIDFLSPTESAKLLADNQDPIINGMAFMALRTGMRFGEIIGLDWVDVDMEKRTINVRRNKVMGIIGTPKNGKVRSIAMASDLHTFLSKQAKKSGPVFHLVDGRELTHHLALNALKRVCVRVGIRKISWHTLRHTTASHLAAEGVPMNVVKELLGHSSILMTSKYAHLAPSAIKDAVELFSQIESREVEKSGHYVGTNEKRV